MPSRSRSRSRGTDSRSQGRDESRRKRKTGWDVGGGGGATDPHAAAAVAAAAAATLPTISMCPMTTSSIQPTNDIAAGNANFQSIVSQQSGLMQNYHNKAMCRIYVGSLDYYLTELELKSVFQAFGNIVSIDMPKEGDRSKGFCFVEYSSPDAAHMALTTMQNFVLKGRTIKVGRPTAVGAGAGQNLMAQVTTSSPVSVMSSAQAGAAAATAILAGRQNVTPQPEITSALAQTQLTPSKFDPLNQQGCNRVYVGNVPFGFSSDDLKKIFVCFGAILNCQLLPSQENPQQHRGYGFIEFASVEAAKLAIETMNGFDVVGKQLKVNYATAMRGALPGFDEAFPSSSSSSLSPPPPPNTTTDIVSVSNNNNNNNNNNNMVVNNSNSSSSPYNINNNNNNNNGGGDNFENGDKSPTNTLDMEGEIITTKPKGTAGLSSVLLLSNMVTPDEVDNDLSEEIEEECSKYGVVEAVTVRLIDEKVQIYTKFNSNEAAASAAPQLHGRWFGGRQILVEYYDGNIP